MSPREIVRRILVVELWNIGDVVLTLPFLAQLRTLFPDSRTTMLAHAHARELLDGTALVDDFIETDLDWVAGRRFDPSGYRWRELVRVVSELRKRKFDLAVQCRPHVREHLLLALSGARRRIGLSFGMSDRLLTDSISIDDPDAHRVDHWLALLAPLGGPTIADHAPLHVSEPERVWAREFLAREGISEGTIVAAVHPGASVAAKRWPLERFHEIAAVLSRRPGLRVIAFAEPGGYGASLSEIPGVVGAKVGLRQLLALIDRCNVLVCNDSGPMHIAGALGVPTVAVFARGIDRWFSPLGEGHELVSPEAHRTAADDGRSSAGDQLASLPVSRVLAGVERVLSRRGSALTSPTLYR